MNFFDRQDRARKRTRWLIVIFVVAVITITLATYPEYAYEVRDTICDVEWYTLPSGVQVNSAGVYFNFLSAEGGCDSIITTYLTLLDRFWSFVTNLIYTGT